MITLELAYKKHLNNEDNARKDIQEKLYHHYKGHQNFILKYLELEMEKIFDPDSIEEYLKDYYNITEKIIDQLAILYKEVPTRMLVDENGEDSEEATEYFNKILPLNQNTIDITQHRLGKLWGTSITMVTWDKTTGRIKYENALNHKYSIFVNDDDYTKIEMVMYDKYIQDELYTIVWTDAENYKLDTHGNKSPIGDNEDMLNPYGVIPFVPNFVKPDEDFWGAPAEDIVATNLTINVLLTFLINDGIFLGTSGTTLAVNLGLLKKGTEDAGVRKVKTGKRYPISVENVGVDKQTPSLQHITTEPYIQQIKDTIDWKINKIAAIKGLNPGSIFDGVKDTSDYQKMMDVVTQNEVRRDDIEPCRIYEKKRFDIIRIINNAHADTEEGRKFKLKKIPENLEFKIDFAEVSIEKTPQDIRDDREFEFKYNMSTPKDWLQVDNPDLTDEQAEEILSKNKELKGSLEKQSTLFDNLLKNRNEVKNVGEQ